MEKEVETKIDPRLGTRYSVSTCSPLRVELKYLGLKMFNLLPKSTRKAVVAEFKAKYLKQIEYIGNTYDTKNPPCVNCANETVYLCGSYDLECRDFVKYYNGRNQTISK